jgi:hypothetical protein
MSTHPNTILCAAFTTDDLPNKTYRAILSEVPNPHDYDLPDLNIPIGDNEYHTLLYNQYDTELQITAKQGQIIVYDFVTYGYGETIEFYELLKRKEELEMWANDICIRHRCSKVEFFVTANYW